MDGREHDTVGTRPSAQPRSSPLLPLSVGIVALLVVIGSALSAPWRAAPRDPGPLLTPEPQTPDAPEQVPNSAMPGELVPDERSFPLTLVLTIAGLLVLFLLLRFLLNRVSFARGTTADTYEPAGGTVAAPGGAEPEPDLPALRRGVAAAREVLAGAGAPGDAVIAAWLELESAAASSGIDRAPAQTPTEFTTAVLDATRADPQATRALLGLYHRARFAPHAALTDADTARAGDCLERIAESWAQR